MISVRRIVSTVARVIAVGAVITAALVFGGPLVRQKLAVRRMLAAGGDFFDECKIESVELVVKDITFDFFDWSMGSLKGFTVSLTNERTSELGVFYHGIISVDVGGKGGLTFPYNSIPIKELIKRLERDSSNRELIRLSGLKECKIAGSGLTLSSGTEELSFTLERQLDRARLAKVCLINPRLEYRQFAPFVRVQQYLDTLGIAFDEVEKLEHWLGHYGRWGVTASLRQNGDLVEVNNDGAKFVHGVLRIEAETGDPSKAKLVWHTKLTGGLFAAPLIREGSMFILYNDAGNYAACCIGLASGEPSWSFTPGFPVGKYERSMFGPSRRITSADIAACGSLLLFRYGTREANKLVALGASTGKEIWRYETGNAVSMVDDSSSVFVMEKTAESTRIKKISPHDGSELWSRDYPPLDIVRVNRGNLIIRLQDTQHRWTHYQFLDGETGYVFDGPKVSGKGSHVYLCENKLYVWGPEESLIWDIDAGRIEEVARIAVNFPSPFDCEEGYFWVRRGDNVIARCYDPQSLELRWEHELGRTEYLSAVGGKLIFNSGPFVCEINANDGRITKAASYKRFRDYENAVVAGTYAAAVVGKIFYIFDQEEGKILYGRKFEANPSGGIGCQDGRVFLTLSNGEIYCYESPLSSKDIARTVSVNTYPRPIY
jgi:outer membrane protein assembly factor BamB